jgi:hypothetical protein
MSPTIVAFLREHAMALRDFAEQADQRKTQRRTRADWTLFKTMNDVKVITGTYQDDLLSDFLDGVWGGESTRGEALRRWRARERTRWQKPQRLTLLPSELRYRIVDSRL